MKIVVAPNAFKDSLSAVEAAEAMAKGIRNVLIDANIVKAPVADGGDGLIEIALKALNGEKKTVQVNDPLGRPIDAEFCYIPSSKTGILEMAEASGLRLLKSSERNPMLTSTFGTGQLIKAALDLGAEKILVGIGGSATSEGGIGAAAALGLKFFDEQRKILEPVGRNLYKIRDFDSAELDPRIESTAFEVLCDVSNPLLGGQGAANVYAPQKGATAEQVEELERGLSNLADIIQQKTGRDIRDMKSGGAAGGLGMGLNVFFNARLRPGVEIVLDLVDIDSALEGCELALTGEGQIDFQTAFGKAPAGVAARARKQGIPCLALAGSVGDDISNLYDIGFTSIFSICPGPVTLTEAMKNADSFLEKITEQAIRTYICGENKG